MATDNAIILRIVRNLTLHDIQQADSTLLATIADYLGQLQTSHEFEQLTPDLMGKMAQLKTVAEQTNLNVLNVKNTQELEEQLAQRHERQRLANHIKQVEALYQVRNEYQLTAEQRVERERKVQQEQQRFQQDVARYMAMSVADFNKLSEPEKVKVVQTLGKDAQQKLQKMVSEGVPVSPSAMQVSNLVANASPVDEQDFKAAKSTNTYALKLGETKQLQTDKKISAKEAEVRFLQAEVEYNVELYNNTKDKYHQLGKRYLESLARAYGEDPKVALSSEENIRRLTERAVEDKRNGKFAEIQEKMKEDPYYILQESMANITVLEKERERLGKELAGFVIDFTKTGKWLGEADEATQRKYNQTRLAYAEATFKEMAANVANKSLERVAHLDPDQTQTLKLTMKFGRGEFSGEQVFTVQSAKGEKNDLMNIYKDVLSVGFEKVAELKGDNYPESSTEYRIKYNAVNKLLEDFTSSDTHFTYQVGDNPTQQMVSGVNTVFGKMLALAKLKNEKGNESKIIAEATQIQLNNLVDDYAKELEDFLRKAEGVKLTEEEIKEVALKLAQHVVSKPDELANYDSHAYDFANQLISNYQKFLDNNNSQKKADENLKNDNSVEHLNNLAGQVKANNGIIANANISASTLNEVHNQELTNRQQAVKNEQEISNKFNF